MKEYQTRQIRNVVILGHGSTGKSTLLDAMLFAGGKIDRVGNPNEGTLVSDFDDEEKKRTMSIRSAMGFVEIDDVKINIIDTPGMADFIGESRSALQVAEAAIIIVDSVDGVQIETEKIWRFVNSKGIPRIFFVNKMEKERANFANVLETLKSRFDANFTEFTLPIGEGDSVSGVVDIINMKAVMPKNDGKGAQISNIPDNLQPSAEKAKDKLTETAAEGDDALIEKYLEKNELTEDEIRTGIKNLMKEARLNPVICGSSIKGIGIKNLLDFIREYAPSPYEGKQYHGHDPNHREKEVIIESQIDKPFSAIVWKTYIDQYSGRYNYLKIISGELLPDCEVINTSKQIKERVTKLYTMIGNKQHEVHRLYCGDIGVVVKLEKTSTQDTICDPKNQIVLPIINLPHPVFSYAIEAANKNDDDKLGQIFNKITDETPTVTYSFNPETKQTVLSGMGEMQLDIILKSILEKNKIEVRTSEPRIAYRETITKKAESQYKHKKQSGGHGQYGDVSIRVFPMPRGGGFEFKDSIVGGAIPRGYIPGVEKGLREGMGEGVLAKYPMVDIKVELFDGSYHSVDSSEMSFKIAAKNALKKAIEDAGPHLLEPVMEVEIYVEKEYMGDILNDITSRRGRILGMGGEEESDPDSEISVIKANVPLSEMLKYSIDLRSITSGKGSFEMKFAHYDPISGRIAEKVIEERKKLFEEEAK